MLLMFINKKENSVFFFFFFFKKIYIFCKSEPKLYRNIVNRILCVTKLALTQKLTSLGHDLNTSFLAKADCKAI